MKDESEACRAWLLKLKGSEHRVFVPSIAYYEVYRAYLALDERQGSTRTRDLNDFLRAFGINRLKMSQQVVDHASILWAYLDVKGKRVSDRTFDGDVMIASEVIQHDVEGEKVLATGNIRHFKAMLGTAASTWQHISI